MAIFVGFCICYCDFFNIYFRKNQYKDGYVEESKQCQTII